MGAFSDIQPQYAAHGVAVFPVDAAAKKPSITNPERIGLPASRKLAEKFRNHDALGFWAGPRNRLTVLDVDVAGPAGERLLADRMDRHGASPLVVRSASAKFHAYYRHAGERRIIHLDGEPVDVLGKGLVIAPPSCTARGTYEIIQGSLDDLDRLPALRGLEAPSCTREKVLDGKRNVTLWRYCMSVGGHCDDFEAVLDEAHTFNLDCIPPKSDAEVRRIARSAWGYTVRGENWFGTGRIVRLDHADIDGLMMEDPDAFLLLTTLRRHHWGREFVVANKMARRMPAGGWTRKRFAAARKALETRGYIVQIKRPSRHAPALYRWASKTGRK